MCLSTIPAANTLLVFAGLESLLPELIAGNGWNLLWKGALKKGLYCDDPQLPYGICPGMDYFWLLSSSASGLPWTRAKACAQTLNE